MLTQADPTTSLGRCLAEYRAISNPLLLNLLFGLLTVVVAIWAGVGLVVVIAVGGVVFLNQLDRRPGQLIIRVVMAAILSVLYGGVAVMMTMWFFDGIISYGVGAIVGVIVAVNVLFKTPFNRLIE